MRLPPFAGQPGAAAAGLFLVVILMAAPSALLAQPTNSACLPAAAEQELLARDTAVLGRLHATEHSRMRAQQCEAERGLRPIPAKGVVSPVATTLQEEEAVRAAADQLAAGIQPSDKGLAQAAASASAQGRWSTPFIIPVVGITSVLLHTGKVLFWSYDPNYYHVPSNSTTGVAYLWDPATGGGKAIAPPENIWCAGQTVLADGRVFIAGGNLRYPDPSITNGTGGWMGSLSTYTFDPLTEIFTKQPDMQWGRWYPTTTKLSDNRVVITSGYDETGTNALVNYVEVFTPSPQAGGIGTIQAVGRHDVSGLYPLQFVLPSGRMLEAGPGQVSSFALDPAMSWSWTALGALRSNHYGYPNGIIYTDASATPLRQAIMVAGGADLTAAVAANEWMDGTNPVGGWSAFPQWLQPRHNSNTVILPDGSLLTIGGNQGPDIYDLPLLQAELYARPPTDPTGGWQQVEPHTIQAAYHSTAILLPDATVLLSQDDMDHTAAGAAQHKAQIFSPAYLFKGTRPRIVNAPATLGYGQTFNITTDRTGVNGAVLVAPGAVTHANDMHQRVVKLATKARGNTNTLAATIPASSGTVPPGYYMLFILDKQGVPSVAKFVKVA